MGNWLSEGNNNPGLECLLISLLGPLEATNIISGQDVQNSLDRSWVQHATDLRDPPGMIEVFCTLAGVVVACLPKRMEYLFAKTHGAV